MFGMKERPKPNKRFYVIVAVVVIVLLAASSILLLLSPNSDNVQIKMDKNACESAGGTWNECGSPCTGAPQGTMCIMACREQCEWHSTAADVIGRNPAYASQPGFSCITQDNGILFCWIAA